LAAGSRSPRTSEVNRRREKDLRAVQFLLMMRLHSGGGGRTDLAAASSKSSELLPAPLRSRGPRPGAARFGDCGFSLRRRRGVLHSSVVSRIVPVLVAPALLAVPAFATTLVRHVVGRLTTDQELVA